MLPSVFALQFDGNRSTLNGHLKTPKGEIKLGGSADWTTFGEGHAKIAAKGVKLRVTLPPAVEFDLTTNLDCEATPELIKLDGSLDLPWARVQVFELPESAVPVSDDVLRLDRPRPEPKNREGAIPIESRLVINVGPDVRFDAMGLRAKIGGQLHVEEVHGKLGLTGQMKVDEGHFRAYGQDLIVRKGEFSFAGSPENPLIDLEAIRNPDKTADNVTAGIRVSGTAEFPEVSVFTDPAKSETEALSYLMRGEGLDPAGDSDNSMITSALINLGLSQGGKAIEQLGDAIGISGLGLDTEGGRQLPARLERLRAPRPQGEVRRRDLRFARHPDASLPRHSETLRGGGDRGRSGARHALLLRIRLIPRPSGRPPSGGFSLRGPGRNGAKA